MNATLPAWHPTAFVFEEPAEEPAPLRIVGDLPPESLPISIEASRIAADELAQKLKAANETALAAGVGEKPEAYAWDLVSGSDGWTKDKDSIDSMSDKVLIAGLLRIMEIVLLVSSAKGCKTWFALTLAVSVALGREFIGRWTRRVPVVYLDYELKPSVFRKRLCLVAEEPPHGLWYQCLRGAERLPSVDDVIALVKETGAGLLVIDSLYRSGWITEESNNDLTSRELAPLQRLTKEAECSVLIVDHTAKGGGAERSVVDAARGASAKAGFADAIFLLRQTDKGPDPEGSYAVLDPEVRDFPKIKDLPLLSFSWDQTQMNIEQVAAVGPSEADADAPRVLEVIASAETGIGRSVIAAAAQLGDTKTRRVLASLVAQGKVVEMPDPRHKQRLIYRLPDFADAPLEPRQTPSNPAT